KPYCVNSWRGKVMKLERWKQIDKLVEAALELDAKQRAALLAEACAGDETLRLEVESQLAVQEQVEASDFLKEPAVKNLLELLAVDQTSKGLYPGMILKDRYKIVRPIGHGGIGVVYLASDLKLHSRRVVIKVLQEGMGQNE